MIPPQCKRLIEVDLPIKTVSEYAREEQNKRKGHLHSLHVWWATRPLAACRAVLLASLIPDPVDKACPEEFKQKASEVLDLLGSGKLSDPSELRTALLDFIGNFSSWESSSDASLLQMARKLVEIASPEGPPLVVDPFAGMGSIPFEALRVGADAYAQDLNPVAVLLLKTDLEYIPRFGQRLSQAVRKWGTWVDKKVKEELESFYPLGSDGSVPYVYLWARQIRCEGPSCGALVPLVGLLWLSQGEKQRFALRYRGDKRSKSINFEIFRSRADSELQSTIVNRFTATCPVCDYTTPYASVGRQLRDQHGGTKDARLIAVISMKPDGKRGYRLPTENDLEAVAKAHRLMEKKRKASRGAVSLVPEEATPVARGPGASRAFSVRKYGIDTWQDAFNSRQALALTSLVDAINEAYDKVLKETADPEFSQAVITCLSLAVSGNLAPYLSSLSLFLTKGMETAFKPGNALPMRPDFAEANPLIPKLAGGFEFALDQVARVIEHEGSQGLRVGTSNQGSATTIRLPDQSVPFVFTDPPYYDAIPYAGLSDFCYVWLKRMVGQLYPELFRGNLTPKEEECILDPGPAERGGPEKDRAFFENTMRKALTECKRVLRPEGIGVVLFAHKGTAGWEALLKALIDAGWTVTASWPIETERGARMRANNSAVLASSVFLVCRPRSGGQDVGDWRQILSELQPRVHTWMERLRKEEILGADAIFACIGPALEVYSRYNVVETAGGKTVELADEYGSKGELKERGYLSYVWEAVAKEALSTIFEGADLAGFEQDSRLSAMWLWTLRGRANGTDKKIFEREATRGRTSEKVRGYPLEYDAARKIAQGLGAHLEELSRPGGLIEIKGNVATLLFVTERREALLGKSSERQKTPRNQTTLLGEPAADLSGSTAEAGRTTLDKLHQAMLLFGDGKTEALRRFLVDEGVGRDNRFWRLADALSALYPRNSEEKRWVEGVITRKKALGF